MIMEESKFYKSLENAHKEDLTNFSNPGNTDKVNIAVGLVNAESAEKVTRSIILLTQQMANLQMMLSQTIEEEVKKVIKSNNEASLINKKAIFWSKWLTIALITVTLVVGLLQVYVIYKTSK